MQVDTMQPDSGEWAVVGRPPYLRQEAEMSLRRLGVERLDLFQLHRIDPQVPLGDPSCCLFRAPRRCLTLRRTWLRRRSS